MGAVCPNRPRETRFAGRGPSSSVGASRRTSNVSSVKLQQTLPAASHSDQATKPPGRHGATPLFTHSAAISTGSPGATRSGNATESGMSR